jgi:membrane-bound lytic murein transglycosylase D
MQRCCRIVLVAVGLISFSAPPRAADTFPLPPSMPPQSASPAAGGMHAAPAAPAFGGESGNDDIPSVQVPVNPAPHAPPVLDLTTAPTSLWTRIRLGFGLPDVATPLVREQEEWFASRPDYLRRTVARSSRYLHYIVEEVQKRGMPTEIALLPIIESAYNPVAYSRAHASGIWQFIPSTGKFYGLQQNFWYDGRRDVMAATNAALDYLQKLYDMFGSWELALASYNWGEGAVGRAIAKNQARGLPTDYLSLTMPNETRYYIPKLQAVKNIVANPAQFGMELTEVPNQPYFTTVTINRHIDVKRAATLAGVPLEEFTSLNPGYSRPVIRANREQTLLLPADKADAFRLNLENHSQPLVSWQAYTLKAGESLDRVALRHGTSVAQLTQANGISGKRRVGPGSTVLVPAAGTATPHLPDLPAPQATAAKAPRKAGKFQRTAVKGAPARAVAHKNAKKPAAVRKTANNSAKKIVPAKKAR